MKDFAMKHPYLTGIFLIPLAAWSAVRLTRLAFHREDIIPGSGL